jgi:predicted negative regulator of RcsB-dependent stress response
MKNDYALIDDYLDGILPKDEQQHFEAALSNDREFEEDVQRHKKIREVLRRHWGKDTAEQDLREHVSVIGAEYFKSSKSKADENHRVVKSSSIAWKAAAVAALFAGALWWQWPSDKSNEIYQRFRHFPEAAFTTQGTIGTSLEDAAATFNAGDFQQALMILQEQIIVNPKDSELIFFYALCQIEVGETEEAVRSLRSLETSTWAEEASWYMALACLKKGDLDACRQLLHAMPKLNPHYEKSRDLLQSIK